MGERLLCTQEVVGSIPVTATSVFSGVTNFLSAKTGKAAKAESTLTAEQDETETG